jgi:hypothetical protein
LQCWTWTLHEFGSAGRRWDLHPHLTPCSSSDLAPDNILFFFFRCVR